jgi:hypothetical protein
VIGNKRNPSAHDQRGEAAIGEPLRVTADGADMRRLAHEAETDAERCSAFRRNRHRLHHRHRPETVATVEHESRGTIVGEPRHGVDVDLAAPNQLQISGDTRHAVTVDTAQIGPDQAFGDGRCLLGAGTPGHQHIADKAVKLVMMDNDLLAIHARAPGIVQQTGRQLATNRIAVSQRSSTAAAVLPKNSVSPGRRVTPSTIKS